jgi:hypothetical protein
MMAVNLGILKKKRSALRNRIKADIQALVDLSEGELSKFEATHAVLDTIINEVDNAVKSYGQPATLGHGLAQTYLPSTLELAEEQAQANGGPVKKVANALKTAVNVLKTTNYQIQGKSADLAMWDDVPGTAKGPETAKLYITKNLGVWKEAQPHVYAQGYKLSVVGGLIAKKTIEEYGYTPEDGYEFQDWSTGEVKLVKKVEPAKYAQVHFCSPKGSCVDFELPKGQTYQISGQAKYALGLTKEYMESSLAEYQPDLELVMVANKDMWVIKWKDEPAAPQKGPWDLDNHLKAYIKQGIKADLEAPSAFASALYKTHDTKSAAVTKAKLEEAYNKVQAGTFNKYDPADVPLKNSAGGVSLVPFKKWLTTEDLQDMGLWSATLPPGYYWHSFDAPNGAQHWLDYKGSKPPVWDNF